MWDVVSDESLRSWLLLGETLIRMNPDVREESVPSIRKLTTLSFPGRESVERRGESAGDPG